MLGNCSGFAAEMNTLNAYFYSAAAFGADEELQRIFSGIMAAEAVHMGYFARLACMHGAEPRLWYRREGKLRYWDPSSAVYAKSPAEAIKAAIAMEAAAIRKYEDQKREIPDKCIRELLTRIVLDERLHMDVFKRLLQRYS